MQKGNCILAVLEAADAQRDEINRDLLAEGATLAKRLGTNLVAVSLGGDDFQAIEGLSALYVINPGSKIQDYSSQLLAGLLEKIPARVLLFPSTDSGRGLAPRIAYRLQTSAVIDVVDIRVREGKPFYVKQCYCDNFEQEITFAEGKIEIAVVLRSPQNAQNAAIPFDKIEVWIDSPEDDRIARLGVTPPNFRSVDIIHAGKILGVGMGCASEDAIKMARELAEIMEASLGTTRPVVDEGLMPKDRMIGMTGKTVGPDFYLALGISGSPHHIAGIQKAKKVVSVNRDPGAPIFQSSDVGFISDVKGVLPLLSARIEKWQRDKNEKL